MTTPRRERVSDLVREEIARLLQVEIHDPRLGFLTVTEVRMSPDLRHARVFVSILASGEARDEAMAALRSLRGSIRRRLGHTLRLRYTPELQFTLDTSMEYGARIESLLEQAHTGPAGVEPAPPGESLPGPPDEDEK